MSKELGHNAIQKSWKRHAAGVMAGVCLYSLPLNNTILVTKKERQQEPK